jgi:ubiquinol-cytochrome c reductase cytochrome c1 subunit
MKLSFLSNFHKEPFLIGASLFTLSYFANKKKQIHSWIYRDDIGAPNGIHGYEEQVHSVGSHHGHYHWTQEKFMTTFDSASVRRGFKVWLKSCQSCHAAYKQKYDIMVDKIYSQVELIEKMKDTPPVHPGHQIKRGYYFNEWDYRQRLICDRIWSTYMTRDHAKSANNGAWPKDLSRTAEHNPAHAGYVYNIMTGYHFSAPAGHEVPEGRYFNPYHNHMIIGMPRQLHDGMLSYEDGTPASTPQMAHDVSCFLDYLENHEWPDILVNTHSIWGAMFTWAFISFWYMKYHEFNLNSFRYEVYALRDSTGYNKFRDKAFRINKNKINLHGEFS